MPFDLEVRVDQLHLIGDVKDGEITAFKVFAGDSEADLVSFFAKYDSGYLKILRGYFLEKVNDKTEVESAG